MQPAYYEWYEWVLILQQMLENGQITHQEFVKASELV